MEIAIAGTGYVDLSDAVLLVQQIEVDALDFIPPKIAQVNMHNFFAYKPVPEQDDFYDYGVVRDVSKFKRGAVPSSARLSICPRWWTRFTRVTCLAATEG